MTDAELVVRVQEGNLEAFNALARKWDGSLYRFLRRLSGNEEDARDLCQEALVKAYVNIGRLREPEKFRPWIHHIALNLYRDRYRSARSRGVMESLDDDPGRHEAAASTGPEVQTHRNRVGEVLSDVLETIPLAQRSAILLREVQGFTTDEIAEITQVPAATVRTRIYYGLRAVRRELESRGITESGAE